MKQETLKEAAEKLYPTIHEIYDYDAFIAGAKWQEEQAKEMGKEQIMRKKTAIEWLKDKLNNVKPTQFCSIETIKEWVEQAKEMEEHQIINAFDAGVGSRKFLGEEYYEKTFKNETK